VLGAALALAVVVLSTGVLAAPADASSRGRGTMLVYDNTTCAGTGNASTVTLPFSLLFTGFEPDVTGTVAAFTQPGGEFVAEATITLGPDGSRCVRVDGDAPSGQYKIVYDFGSGTGKQKVIRVINPGDAPVGTPPPTTTTITSTGTVTQTVTSTETITETVTATDTGTTPPVETTGTTTSTQTVTSTETGAVTSTATVTTTPSFTPGPSDTDVEGDLDFTPVDPLAPSGASGTGGLLPAGLVLLVAGAALVAVSRRGWAASPARRH
jgi:hypothetical protein